MECASCGRGLAADARFCPRCGGRVELGSILGVGTDLSPVPPGGEPASEREPAEPTRALVRRDVADPNDLPPGGGRGSSGEFTPGRIAAMVATFVALTVVGTFVLTQLFGSPTQGSSAASEASESSANPSSANPSATTPSGQGTSGSSAPSPTASPSLPDGARRCSRSGDDAVASAYSGNRDTSCAFTNAVRTAYREAGSPTDSTPFRVYSPVTKRWYDVTCTGGPVLRCADGAAVVHLGP